MNLMLPSLRHLARLNGARIFEAMVKPDLEAFIHNLDVINAIAAVGWQTLATIQLRTSNRTA